MRVYLWMGVTVLSVVGIFVNQQLMRSMEPPTGPRYVHQLENWRSTQGFVTHLRKSSKRGHSGDSTTVTYYVTMKYDFDVEGVTYDGKDVYSTRSRSKASKLASYPLDQKKMSVTVHYNSENPGDSHLFQRLTNEWSDYESRGVSGVCWIFVCLFLAIMSAVQAYREWRRQAKIKAT